MAGARTVRVAAAAYALDALPTLGAIEEKIARRVAKAAGDGAKPLDFPRSTPPWIWTRLLVKRSLPGGDLALPTAEVVSLP